MPQTNATLRSEADVLVLVAADGYAAMFVDAPPPTAEDLRGLAPAEPRLMECPAAAAWGRMRQVA